MECRLALQGLPVFQRHSFCREDDDWRDIGLKDLQPLIDAAFVRDDYAKRTAALTAFDPNFLQFSRQPEPNIVALQTGVAKQHRVCQRSLPKQMQLVLT